MRRNGLGALTIVLLLLAFVAWRDRGTGTVPSSSPAETVRTSLILGAFDCEVRAGDVHFTGTVENVNESRTVRFVKMRASLLDEGGRQVNTAWNYTDSDRIPPGGTSTYSVWVDNAPSATTCDIEIESAEFTD